MNHRILVIDDNSAIHDDIRKILAPAKPESPARLASPLSTTGSAPVIPLRTEESDSPNIDAALLARSGVMSPVRLSSNEAAMTVLL